MRILIWFWLSCKRQLKHGFFIAILLVMPLALFGFSQLEQQDSGKIRIAVFSEDDELVPEIIENLLAQDGMFEFYVCDSEQVLKDDVAGRRAECGYVFLDGFKEKLDSRRFKRSIEVYSAPSTIMGTLSTEVVFASVIEEYGEEILEQFAAESDLFEGQDRERAQQELKELYAQQISGGKTFSFRYETLSTEQVAESSARIAFPVRGILAVYLMVIGMFAAVSLCKDERKGLFISLPFGYGIPCRLAALAAPVALAGISAVAALAITGNLGNPLRELAVLVLYLLLTVLFSYLLKLVVRDPVLLCGLIPVFILVSLVVCPVFFDVSQWLPGLKPIRSLLLPYYYMRFF